MFGTAQLQNRLVLRSAAKLTTMSFKTERSSSGRISGNTVAPSKKPVSAKESYRYQSIRGGLSGVKRVISSRVSVYRFVNLSVLN